MGAGFALAFLVLAANAATTCLNLRTVLRHEAMAGRAGEAIYELERVASVLAVAETGQRGYLLTGDETHLSVYWDARPDLLRCFDHLERLTADVPGQGADVAALKRAALNRLGELEWVKGVRDRAGLEAARAAMRDGVGSRLMDEVRRRAGELRGTLDDLIDERVAGSRIAVRRMATTVGLVSGLALLLLAAAYALGRRERATRARSEQALREGEASYRLLFDENPNPMWVLDAETLGFLDVNEATVRHYGYTREEFLAMTVADIRPAEDVPALRAAVAQDRDEPTRGLWRHRKNDGSPIDVEVTSRSLPFRGRRALLALVRDVTEQRRAEATLAHERHLLRALLENVPDKIYFKDAEGRFTQVSRASARASGLDDPAQKLGKTDFDYFAEEEARAFAEEELQIMRTGRPVVGKEEREVWKDGRVTWALTTKMPLRDEAGRVAGTFGISTDITDRKHAEAALRRAYVRLRLSRRRLRVLSRRLVEAQEAERRRIARELHDEVGQVLTGLKLSLEMADRRAAGGDGAAAPLAEAKGLVNGLMARVRALSLDLRPTMLDDLGLLPALLWQFEQYAARTGVRVDFEHAGLERRFRPEVETAAYRIAQEALTNVARHAGVAEVRVRLWAKDDALLLQVEDQGAGFDLEAADSVGRSSGLSGMRERAALLGGRLTLASAPGSGTTLAVELPAEWPAAGPRRRAKRAASSGECTAAALPAGGNGAAGHGPLS
jgi:PAS domain S-box-containing protein